MTVQRTRPVVGLLGGVGSGKSTLARRAAERYGLVVVDGDAAGHRVLTDSGVKARLRDRFGDDIFDLSGKVDRSLLAERVFGPAPEHLAAKRDLEQITHPAIARELEQRIGEARAAGVPAILLDAAVLLEAGWQDYCDAILFIEVPDNLRYARVAGSRGWTESQWRDREASQLTLDRKRRSASAAIENSGTPEEAVQALVAAIETICGIRLPESAQFAASSA